MTIKRLAQVLGTLFVAASLGLVAPACATTSQAGPITLAPSEQQIQKTREAAIKIAGAIETAAGLTEQALKFADGLERAGKLAPAKLATLATAGKKFALTARSVLTETGAVGANPSLMNTVTVVLRDLDPFLAQLEASENETLRVLAGSIRIGVQILTTFKIGIGGVL